MKTLSFAIVGYASAISVENQLSRSLVQYDDDTKGCCTPLSELPPAIPATSSWLCNDLKNHF